MRFSAGPGLLTPADVRRLLDEHGLAPRKAAGQNFVVDPNTVRKIVRDAGVGDDDVILEIGPGLGSLTLALAAAARRVVAVEIDSGLVSALREVTAGLDNVEVVHADALRVELTWLLGGDRARMVSNLPYNIATPLVFRALETPAIEDLFVMVQREVGERWAARPGDPLYAGLSAKLALAARVEVVARVPRSVFLPVPNVDSVTVRILRREDAYPPEERTAISAVIDAAFAQRRKTLRNALRRLAAADDLSAAFGAAGVAPGARAEELGVEDFVRLAAGLITPKAVTPTSGVTPKAVTPTSGGSAGLSTPKAVAPTSGVTPKAVTPTSGGSAGLSTPKAVTPTSGVTPEAGTPESDAGSAR